jgi:hypothetical protein
MSFVYPGDNKEKHCEMNYLGSIYANWKFVLADKIFRRQVIITLLLYGFLFKYCRVVMTQLELRTGTRVIDPLLSYFTPRDFSPFTFSLTYIALGLFIFSGLVKPKAFIIALQAYCLLIIMRTIAIYMVPLEPPTGMILLKDPVTYFFMSTPTGDYIVKDLFFSGHVSTIVLFGLSAQRIWVKRSLFVIALLVGTLILGQHVHYTIDVVAAPLFAFLAYKASAMVDKLVHRTNPALSFEENKSS